MEELMIPFPQNAALVLIDIQKGFDNPMWGRRNNPDAETNMAIMCYPPGSGLVPHTSFSSFSSPTHSMGISSHPQQLAKQKSPCVFGGSSDAMDSSLSIHFHCR
jgi:nicotinamidase-related amidase